MSKDRLLSDEELLWHIRKTENPHYACEFKQDNTERKTVKCGGCLRSSESARNAENALIKLINTQKRLYAESVDREARIDELRNTVLRDGEIYFHMGEGNFMPVQERFNQLRAESEN